MTEPGDAIAGSPRLAWKELPAAVHEAIEDHLGSVVVAAVNQVGGFSPGTAARVECYDDGEWVALVGS